MIRLRDKGMMSGRLNYSFNGGMVMGYTKEKLLNKIDAASENMHLFYKQQFINYRGKTIDTEELYSELIAEWCINNIERFELIPMITRETTYKIESHNGIPKNEKSNRKEELIAMELYRQGFLEGLGKVIDYQTPLKNQRGDKAGKIDLLSYDGMTMRILELKEPNSDETMLRCVLEGYTYMKTVDKTRLLSSFDVTNDAKVMACPLVFKGGVQWQEMQEDRPKLKELMSLLKSTPFYLEKNKDKYIIEEESYYG